MQKIILQVPMDKHLKNSAEKVASEQGFSSLQEIVRVFLSRLASKKVELVLQDSIILSSKNERRYSKMSQDFKADKNVSVAENNADLISQLNEN